MRHCDHETQDWWFLAVAAVILAAALTLAGCAASKIAVAAQTTASVASLSLTAAEAFGGVDRQKIEQITDNLKRDRDWEKAERDRDAWDGKALKAKQAFLAINLGIQSAREAIELAAKGKQVNFAGEIPALIKLFVSLRDVLKSFGIAMPTGGLL